MPYNLQTVYAALTTDHIQYVYVCVCLAKGESSRIKQATFRAIK